MNGVLGPRHDRSESAKLPDALVEIEGLVSSELIPGLFISEADPTPSEPNRKTIEPGRGEISVLSFRRDPTDGKLRLKQSGRTESIINLSTEPLPHGAHVRARYDPTWGQFVPYYTNCSPWTLTDAATYEVIEQ